MRTALGLMVLSSAALAVTASAATIVPGTANPNLAGRASGYTCCSGDSVPEQSPVEVEAELEDCGVLTLSVSGRVSFDGNVQPGNNGDGDTLFEMTNYGDGISAPTSIRSNALVGVFLDDTSPTGDPTPPRLEFPDVPDFPYLLPRLGQIFFIGDGQTTDSKAGATPGVVQEFRVPTGATRLFLGTSDGFGWSNNSGSFTVDFVHGPDPSLGGCGDAVPPEGIFASDALYALKTAVGTGLCPNCWCDADGSEDIVASDALRVLRAAVGQPVELRCECCPPMV